VQRILKSILQERFVKMSEKRVFYACAAAMQHKSQRAKPRDATSVNLDKKKSPLHNACSGQMF